MTRTGPRRTRWRFDDVAAPGVWAVGPWHAGEFAALRERLDQDRVWHVVTTLNAAVEQMAAVELAPEVVLLAQPRPGADEQALVDRLQVAAPLVRLVVVAGTWCEGELRTGRPPVGVTRLYWHELPGWWRQALARRDAGLAPHWSGVGHALAEQGDIRADRTGDLRTVAVDAIDVAVYESLDVALRPLGWQSVWTPRGRDVRHAAAAGIWDGGQLDAGEQVALREFCQQFSHRPAPVVVLVDYPRVEHIEFVRDAGAGALLGKPYRLEELADELAQHAQVDQGAQSIAREQVTLREPA